MEYAEGLFFQKGLASPTIRIQAPSIAMVFTDGPALGAGLSFQTKRKIQAPFTFLFLSPQIWKEAYSSTILKILGWHRTCCLKHVMLT